MNAQVTIDLKEFMSLKETVEKIKSANVLLSEIDNKGIRMIIETDDKAVATMMSEYKLADQKADRLEKENEELRSLINLEIEEKNGLLIQISDLKTDMSLLNDKFKSLKDRVNEIFETE